MPHSPTTRVPNERASVARLVNLILTPLALAASWLARGPALRAIARLAARLASVAHSAAALPISLQLALLGLLILVSLEVWFVDVKWVLYGTVWRTLYPDLVLCSTTTNATNFVGRAYRVEPNTDGSYTIHFSQRGRGILQVFRGLQRLQCETPPQRLNARQLALHGEGIQRTAYGLWRIATDALPTSPLAHQAVEGLLARPLRLNQLVTKEGLEGNPYHLSRLHQSFALETPTWTTNGAVEREAR